MTLRDEPRQGLGCGSLHLLQNMWCFPLLVNGINPCWTYCCRFCFSTNVCVFPCWQGNLLLDIFFRETEANEYNSTVDGQYPLVPARHVKASQAKLASSNRQLAWMKPFCWLINHLTGSVSVALGHLIVSSSLMWVSLF